MKNERYKRPRGPWLALAVVALLLGLAVYLCSGPREGSLAWYVDQLKPDMTESDVRALMPTDYFIAARSILPRACEEAKPECRLMRCYADNTPVAWEHLYGDIRSTTGIANVDLYFATNHVLVGWSFSASGAEMPSGHLGVITVRVVRANVDMTNAANQASQVTALRLAEPER